MEETMPLSKAIQTLYSFDTEYTADSVEWCPHHPNQNVFVCGTYQRKDTEPIVGSQCEKVGRVLVFSIVPVGGLKLHQSLDTAAILDQKWCPNKINGTSLLGVVNAKGTLEIYKLNSDLNQLELVSSCVVPSEEDSETLLLSLDWSTGKYKSEHPKIICSDSRGNVHRLSFTNSELVLEQSWHGHEFQAWICGFYYWDTNTVFTGGDDCLFLKYDARVGSKPVAKNKSHEAGVTSIHSNAIKEYVLVTGSYDSHVRLWDVRYLKDAVSSVKTPGAVWRLKWDPFVCSFILAACMHEGVHIIDAATSENLSVCESYYNHKDISYGADWSYMPPEEVDSFEHDGNAIIGSCSFYDHLLCVSKLACNFNK